MNELYSIRTVEDENSLQHYGVLGMKWGVHRNASQAYGKEVAKRNKLNNRVEKTHARMAKANIKANTGVAYKYKKLDAKANKLQSKADKKKYGFFPNAKKAAELQAKADRARYKANKYESKAKMRDAKAGKATAKYMKAQRKAEKWQKAMDKTFANVDINSIVNSSTTANGKKKVNALLAS